jgi:hypothetical protein
VNVALSTICDEKVQGEQTAEGWYDLEGGKEGQLYLKLEYENTGVKVVILRSWSLPCRE